MRLLLKSLLLPVAASKSTVLSSVSVLGLSWFKAFMGSERVLGSVAVREVEGGRENERAPLDRNKSLVLQKVENGIECASFSNSNRDPATLASSKSDDFQLSSKCKKLSKNGSGCSKKPRLAQTEDSLSLGQIPKQRASCGVKRSDKRNAKVSARTKSDSFSLKNGTAIFNSSSGVHNVLGYYGLRPNLHDISKQLNELSLTEHSLEELLDGTSSCENISKERAKDTPNTNEKIVQSIKIVCSILAPWRPSQPQASCELEGNFIKKVSPGTPRGSCVPNVAHDKRDSFVVYQIPLTKESCSCPENLANALNFPLHHPSVILELLGLQPPDDFESLILGAMKPILSVREGFDSRSGKRVAPHPYLPAFSWSHTFGGHCKSTTDALKLSTSRSLCQSSIWARIGNTAGFCGVASDDFADFSKLNFDPNLVPQAELIYVNFASEGTGYLPESSLVASDSRASNIPRDEHPPNLIIAAQILCDLAKQPMPPDLSRLLRWPKKPLEKPVKARKYKYDEKFARPFSRPKSILGYDSVVRHSDQAMPAKKTKLTSTDKKKDVALVNGMAKGPLVWSGPKSCRSSSYRSVKDTKSEHKCPSSDVSKQSIGLAPVRILDKASNSQQKPRKVIEVYWER
uniref:Uncharacterized protein n=1 Tax=Kalanchoe fedtschenkoi TaxID=63787 RepID=A0A7N0UVM1_KALFE